MSPRAARAKASLANDAAVNERGVNEPGCSASPRRAGALCGGAGSRVRAPPGRVTWPPVAAAGP